MEAMILAAGAGTRLRPITDRLPKALIPVRQRPLLAHVLERLVAVGATRVIINVCHHAEQIAAYLERHTPTGIEIALSPEPDGPYDTGGGLLAAAPLFRRDGAFLLHNVDVLSRIPLEDVLAAHRAARAQPAGRVIASVAVQARDANRRLLFDANGLMGWENRADDGTVLASDRVRQPSGPITPWSFTGIHTIEPEVFALAERTGHFSIVTWYLDMARRGYTILPVDVTGYEWIDVGTHERLAEAEGRDERPSVA
jgi:MurNAc alpha-1-phosphate uridylyltransferase